VFNRKRKERLLAEQQWHLAERSLDNATVEMRPPLMSVGLCRFCTKNGALWYVVGVGEFCSYWCRNYWFLNDEAPAHACRSCGWLGCYQDFADSPPSLCKQCVVSDDEFEAYRASLLQGRGA
jgi:hypothetical protein